MKQLYFIISCFLTLMITGCTGSTAGDSTNNRDDAVADSISWSAPTTRVDGTALSNSEISGYRLSYGMDPANLEYIDNLSSATESISLADLPPGTWFFWVQTIDSHGRVGPPSAINSVTIR